MVLGISLPGLFITLAIAIGVFAWLSKKVQDKEEGDEEFGDV